MKKKSSTALTLLVFALSGCAYIPETIYMDNYPPSCCESINRSNDIQLGVQVLDCRRGSKALGYKKGDNQVELGSLSFYGNLSQFVASAIRQELRQRGFNVVGGNVLVQVSINKFNTDFKKGFIRSRNLAELYLDVNVQDENGIVFYSKTIMGFGENKNVWIQNGKNAKVALQDAFTDAINKLLNDKAFIQSLFRANHMDL
jgi:uncharacterized lipoprotein YajG